MGLKDEDFEPFIFVPGQCASRCSAYLLRNVLEITERNFINSRFKIALISTPYQKPSTIHNTDYVD